MILPGSELMPLIRAALERGQRVRMTVNGASMLPFIHNDDTVELEPLTSSLRLGDIVLAQNTCGCYVVHRVALVKATGLPKLAKLRKSSPQRDEQFYLRGDAQTCKEGPLAPENIFGKVLYSEHHGKIRDHTRGIWHILGRGWVSIYPVGFYLFQSYLRLRRLGGKSLRRLQRGRVFRRWLKRTCPAYTIQEASYNDLVALYVWLSPDGALTLPESERKTHPGLTNYVARCGEKVLGFVRLMRRPETEPPYSGHWLFSLTVRSHYRGMGLGEALTQHVIEQSRSEGSSELYLCVFEDNLPAIALYRKLGFERVSLPAVEETLSDDIELYGHQRVPFRKMLQKGSAAV
ncbi:GNAT family N-acetyltransferase [Candidatus Bipolaricaulota bacterium]|nr:GNAT family N-acetyltransferase [Candidatus Bipolaricaulota bacterium]